LIVSNEGDLPEDFAVRYWITTDAEGSFQEGVQATQFVKLLRPSSELDASCSLKEVTCSDCKDKSCSRVADEVQFEVPTSGSFPMSYWCKAETCRGWTSSSDDCSGGVRSSANKLLTVRGLGQTAIEEVPSKVTFGEFWLSGGRILSDEHRLFGSVFLSIILLLIQLSVVHGAEGVRNAGKRRLEGKHKEVKF